MFVYYNPNPAGRIVGVINQQQYNLAAQKAQMLQSLLGRY